jgi:DNA modification methylase
MIPTLPRPGAAEPFLYRRVGPVSLHVGDALGVLPLLPAECVDAIVCSPPYWQSRDYGTGRWAGGDPTCPHPPPAHGKAARGRASRGGCRRCGAQWTDLQYGLEPHLDTYLTRLQSVFRAARRVLKPAGTLWLNVADRYSTPAGAAHPAHLRRVPPAEVFDTGQTAAQDGPPRDEPLGPERLLEPKQLLGIPWRVALALQADGWWLRNAIVWAKTNPMPESVTDRLSATYELLFLLTRGPHYHFDLDPIRIPLRRPEAADGTRVFGGSNKAHLGTVDASARRRGTTYRRRPPHGGKYEPDSGDRRLRAYRGNLAATGHAHTTTHPRGRNPGDVWRLPTRPYRGAHTAPYPIDLPLAAIAAGSPPGGHILDPFSGAGTTGLAALILGRTYTGIDLRTDFHDRF